MADAGSIFAGWSGDCSGTAGLTNLLMDGDWTCTATFDILADVIYVPCGLGLHPCEDTIGDGWLNINDNGIIKVADSPSSYVEDLLLNEAKTFTMQAMDATFTNPSSVAIAGGMTVTLGTIIFDKGTFTVERVGP